MGRSSGGKKRKGSVLSPLALSRAAATHSNGGSATRSGGGGHRHSRAYDGGSGTGKHAAKLGPGKKSSGKATRGSEKARPGPAFDLAEWLDDFEAVSAAVSRHGDLEALLNAGGGITKIRGFLPPAAAAGLLALLRRVPPPAWRATEAARDYAANNISHAFDSTKRGGGDGEVDEQLAKAFRVMSLLRPGELFTFSAARYARGHHIEPHDDRAYTNVRRAARSTAWGRARRGVGAAQRC
ncbi:hypothetical protein MNEG_5005 [Monoraphidium neglectum]|uniref:Uncharacterized protein n=1 Tax=Monoraphidium neglectum TaxID=145388 RepID=A0A0D2L7W9_9CHLO|nr:hypothetical protein MNEG_5005 [Monoraphidium neglectum]KIZ02959.1 hypothetical protein MNEG_5005 [Monoraphidium neglectum]|eukprot:XP_013901978.1 hypothetical protein MNEG_5005 [Monoraphidium neglectum]